MGAMAVVDDLPEACLGFVPSLSILNEVCARRARGELRKCVGTDESAVVKAARKRAAAFLGVSNASAPHPLPLEDSEPRREAVLHRLFFGRHSLRLQGMGSRCSKAVGPSISL